MHFFISIILIVAYFGLSALLVFSNLDFRTFNLIEGINWIVLGLFALSLSNSVPKKHKKLTIFAFMTLIIFGITDFIEIKTGAYWIPSWLLALNILCIAGMIFSLAWFAIVRYKP